MLTLHKLIIWDLFQKIFATACDILNLRSLRLLNDSRIKGHTREIGELLLQFLKGEYGLLLILKWASGGSLQKGTSISIIPFSVLGILMYSYTET